MSESKKKAQSAGKADKTDKADITDETDKTDKTDKILKINIDWEKLAETDTVNLMKEIEETAASAILKHFTETVEAMLPRLAELIEKYGQLPNTKEFAFLRSIIPEKFYIPNNKLANEMVRDFVDRGEIQLSVIKPKTKGEIVTYNSLTYDDENITILGSREFTAYDRTIHNAVCSLYAAGNDVITPAMVYRAVNGSTKQQTPSEQELDSIRNSLDKSRFLRLKVDFTDEAKARGFNVDKTTIDSHLLDAKVLTVTAGGKKVEAYQILAKPVLYEYAQYTRQILSVPSKLLDTKEATRNTDRIIPIKEYLIRRIEVMKNDKEMSRKILYETVFDEVGLTVTDKKQRDRLRLYISAILSLWKARDKYISGFKEFKEGKSFKGIEVLF